MHPFYVRVFVFIIFVVSTVFGLQFSQEGFTDIESFKKLERLVPTRILGTLEGESHVTGWAAKSSADHYLESPKTKTPSLYYRYLLEREERDSDGHTRWVTVKDQSRSVDFILEDITGKATVLTAESIDKIRWFLPERYSHTAGSYRHTEWRVEPNNKVSLFAWANLQTEEKFAPGIRFRFDKSGEYTPVITTFSAAEVRADIGNSAIIKIWGGISLISLGLMCFVYALQLHRILFFLSLLTIVTTAILATYGIASLSSDVRGGSDYFYAQQDKAELAVRELFASEAITWQGWSLSNKQNNADLGYLPSWKQIRIDEIRQNLGVLQARYQQQIAHFPENMFAWLNGLNEPLLRIDLSEEEKRQVNSSHDQFIKTQLSNSAYWWVIAGVLAFSLLTYLGFRFAKVKRMIENIPTSATAGVSFGLAEVKGKVTLIDNNALTGPLTSLSCVWYRYLVEEKRGSGKKSRWVTLSDNTQHQRFYCEDDDGRLTIDPDDADISTRHCKVSRDGRMRYSEWLIKPSDTLYALGMAKVDPYQPDQLLLGKPQHKTDQSDLFILTNYSEKELMIKKASIAMLALAFAFSGMFCASVFAFGMNGQFAATDYLMSALIAPAFLILFMVVLHYNDLVFLQNRADRNWANIQVSLKKRADLLPQLVKVLSEYKVYESSLLEAITLQRQHLKKSMKTLENVDQFIAQEHHIKHGLKLAIEAYPSLKANEMSQSLMDTLTALENEIALMRTGYNDAVNVYNTRIESFPDLILAKLCNFVKKALI